MSEREIRQAIDRICHDLDLRKRTRMTRAVMPLVVGAGLLITSCDSEDTSEPELLYGVPTGTPTATTTGSGTSTGTATGTATGSGGGGQGAAGGQGGQAMGGAGGLGAAGSGGDAGANVDYMAPDAWA